jgi:GDP-4-dehydro-6-deoxy-D-mannose reductase
VPPRVLVTGAVGFVGPHLIRRLLASGQEVWASNLHPAAPGSLPAGVGLIPCDIGQAEAVAELVARTRPDRIYHLAGFSSPGQSLADPLGATRVNFLGTLHLLDGIRRVHPPARLLLASSPEVYGRVAPGDLPLTERHPVRPVTPYGMSKAAAELAATQYARAYGLDVRIARAFNHTGRGQTEQFVCPSLARQVVEIAAGLRPPPLEAGNLEVVRDFSDVRDIVAGYERLMERGEPGEVYQLCTGRPVALREVVALIQAAAGVEVPVVSIPTRVRPVDIPALWGSPAKAEAGLGWRGTIPLAETVRDLVAEARERLAAAKIH